MLGVQSGVRSAAGYPVADRLSLRLCHGSSVCRAKNKAHDGSLGFC